MKDVETMNSEMKECIDNGCLGFEDLPLHFRVMKETGELTATFHSSLPNARRAAADIIKGGGVAVIFQSIEVLIDKGSTLEIETPESW